MSQPMPMVGDIWEDEGDPCVSGQSPETLEAGGASDGIVESGALNLWVDDQKPAPEGCAVARTYADALSLLRRFDYVVLYLDHDLAEGDDAPPGYDLLMQLIAENRVPPTVECISWNPSGRMRINAALADYRKTETMRGTMLLETARAELKRARCAGCHDDFYNGRNGEMCWQYADAKPETVFVLGTWDSPMERKNYRQVEAHNCYHPTGGVVVKQIREDAT